MQKALREAERLAEIEIRREQREMEKKEKEKQKEREKEEKEKMKMLAAANLAGNVKLTPPKPSATAPKTGAGTTGKSRNGFWKTITFSSNIATNDSNDVSEKKEKEATNNEMPRNNHP
jgi:hypothetical protein